LKDRSKNLRDRFGPLKLRLRNRRKSDALKIFSTSQLTRCVSFH